jgi:hypothetical protein
MDHDSHYRNKTHGGGTQLVLIFRLQEATKMEGGGWLDVCPVLTVSRKFLVAWVRKSRKRAFFEQGVESGF